jgi:hypothetical protein
VFPTGESVKIIYESTPAGSPARKLLVDLHAKFGLPGWVNAEEAHVDFLVELTQHFLNLNVGKPPTNRNSELVKGYAVSYRKGMSQKTNKSRALGSGT